MSGPKKWSPGIQGHFDFDGAQEFGKPSLRDKASHEAPVLQHGKQLWRSASPAQDAADTHAFQGKIARFSPINRGKPIQGFDADRIVPGEAVPGDDRTGVFRLESLRQPIRLGLAAIETEKGVEINQAGPGQNALIANVAAVRLPEVL